MESGPCSLDYIGFVDSLSDVTRLLIGELDEIVGKREFADSDVS